jgi:hypothetical protein
MLISYSQSANRNTVQREEGQLIGSPLSLAGLFDL